MIARCLALVLALAFAATAPATASSKLGGNKADGIAADAADTEIATGDDGESASDSGFEQDSEANEQANKNGFKPAAAFETPGPEAPPQQGTGWRGYLPYAVALLFALLSMGYARRKIRAVEDRLEGRLSGHSNRMERLEAEQRKQLKADDPEPGSNSNRTSDAKIARSKAVENPTPQPSPAPAPLISRGNLGQAITNRLVQAAVDDYRGLLQQSQLSGSAFVAAMTRHGALLEVVASNNDGLRLGYAATGGPGELLAGVKFEDGTVLLIPSADFIMEFSLTYKESLDIGPLIQMAFRLDINGSGNLSYEVPALARAGANGELDFEQAGLLAGFTR
ncbi:hypothetical protein [Sphingomonas sp. LT1P40]|uniref:hypothetical protein n=1 Tax=Alteristakelama amylovorans TaxID=3096166 RepID=UPI002FC8FBBD